MSIQSAWQGTFSFFDKLPIIIEPSRARLSSDAGLLPLREFDERIGLTRQFAEALQDPRCPKMIDHPFLEMVRARVYGILAGYEDQNDHDCLRGRHDCWDGTSWSIVRVKSSKDSSASRLAKTASATARSKVHSNVATAPAA
jgi:hypothetical protein